MPVSLKGFREKGGLRHLKVGRTSSRRQAAAEKVAEIEWEIKIVSIKSNLILLL